MKERIYKMSKAIKLVTGGLLLAALMVVNVQVGLNGSNEIDLSNFDIEKIELSVYTPSLVASQCAWWDFWCVPGSGYYSADWSNFTSASASCAGSCSASCEIMGFYWTGCAASGCEYCRCEGHDEYGNVLTSQTQACSPPT